MTNITLKPGNEDPRVPLHTLNEFDYFKAINGIYQRVTYCSDGGNDFYCFNITRNQGEHIHQDMLVTPIKEIEVIVRD